MKDWYCNCIPDLALMLTMLNIVNNALVYRLYIKKLLIASLCIRTAERKNNFDRKQNGFSFTQNVESKTKNEAAD